MAETASGQPVTRSTFPPPPPFWRLYPADTPDSVRHSPLTSAAASDPAASSSPLPTPFNLPLFTPPPIPTTPYIKFQHLLPPHPSPPPFPTLPLNLLPASPTSPTPSPSFPPSPSIPSLLTSLLSSLLASYTSLLTSLTSPIPTPTPTAPHPHSVPTALTSLTQSLLGMVGVLGWLREGQARVGVGVALERQRARRGEEVRRLREEVGRVREMLKGYGCEWEEGSREVEGWKGRDEWEHQLREAGAGGCRGGRGAEDLEGGVKERSSEEGVLGKEEGAAEVVVTAAPAEQLQALLDSLVDPGE